MNANTINCNFTNVFAQFNTEAEVREIANIIRGQLINAYNDRITQIKEGVTVTPTIDVTVTTGSEPTKAPKEPKTEVKPISLSDTKAIKKLGLTFEKYSEKCWVLRGDTKPIKDELREKFDGVYNSRLKGGEGYIIRNKHVETCAKALGIKNVKVA